LHGGSNPGRPGSGEDFIQIGDLRENYAPAKLRSAVYKVAATIPGVQLLGMVRDHAGRPGIGLAKVDRGIRHELIFDPRTSALLGEQQTIATRGSGVNGPVGTVIGWAVYLRSAIVDTLPRSRPAFRALPIPSQKGNTPRLLPRVTGPARADAAWSSPEAAAACQYPHIPTPVQPTRSCVGACISRSAPASLVCAEGKTLSADQRCPRLPAQLSRISPVFGRRHPRVAQTSKDVVSHRRAERQR
jgi:hypothetical protein